MTAPANHNRVAGDQLRAYVERAESINAEIAGLNSDKSKIFKEAEGNGFDPKIIKKVIFFRRQDKDERELEATLLEMYLTALGEAV